MQDYHQLIKDDIIIQPHLPVRSVSELLTTHSAEFGDKEALIFLDVDSGKKQSYTYRELITQIKILSHLLTTTYALRKGDAIALHLGNSPFLLFLHLAAWTQGIITVPLDLKRDTNERKLYKITSTNAKLIAGSKDATEKSLQEKLPMIPFLYEEELQNVQVEQNLTDSSLREMALVLFTSGTTAQPKGVSLTAENIFLNADGIADWLQITENDRFFIVLPLHHINSTTMSMATLLKGGTIILVSRYTRTKFFQLMAETKTTLSSIVPTICLDLLSETEQFQTYKDSLLQVTRIQIGSAPVVQPDVKEFIKKYRIPLVQGYGSTETALRVSGVKPWGLDNPLYTELVEVNTIGSELTWNNLTVLTENGTNAKEGEIGEICVRGPILTSGYLRDKPATDKAFSNGWFHTGDVGFWKQVASEKQYFISGRAKEIIIKGGINISPLSVEDALLKNFKEIKTCFIVGAIDARFGEEVAAVLVFQSDCARARQEEVVELIKAHQKRGLPNLSSYEMPEHLFVTQEKLLPTTSTGKVQRVVIRSFVNCLLHPVTETSTHIFRQLTPLDTDFLSQAVTIHNTRFGKDLGIDEETIEQTTAHGIVLGVIEKATGSLKGVLFALQAQSQEVESLSSTLQTYDSATANLTLKSHDSLGDSLLLVSVATEGEPFEEHFDDALYTRLQSLAENEVNDYLPQDPVLAFHRKAKAGMEKGAEVLYVIKSGRVKDKASLGYSVIMKYPQFTQTPTITSDATLGMQLLEAGFLFAYDKEVKQIYAYSRPAGLYRFLKQKTK